MREAGGGTAKTLAKLEKTVQAGNYYEAQQVYKTVYSRYIAAKKYDDATQLLQSGACVQLKHGQITCGSELAVLLIETFGAAGVVFGSSALDRIKTIYNEFPRVDVHEVAARCDGETISEDFVAARTRVEGCTSFLKAAIKWSAEAGGPSKGAPELHRMLADYIWKQSPIPEFSRASSHYIQGNCPESYAEAVVDCIEKCFPGEADLVVARAVLVYLALGNLRDANVLWEKTIQRYPERTQHDLPDTPLMHFIKFLLQTLERSALPLFRLLREKYKPSTDRDSSFDEYLDEIAERFYGVRRKNGIQGMLGDFMKMFADV